MKSALVLLVCFGSVLATVPVATKCPDTWKWFKRSRGGWCMKVFAAIGTQADAEAKCKAEGAVVAGVQNTEEIKWMSATLQSLQTNPVGTLWVGAKRTKPCISSGLTKQCSAITSFYWSDQSAVGVQGFFWRAGEPNNALGGQGCAQVYSTTNDMDDVGCGSTNQGYICGKVATF